MLKDLMIDEFAIHKAATRVINSFSSSVRSRFVKVTSDSFDFNPSAMVTVYIPKLKYSNKLPFNAELAQLFIDNWCLLNGIQSVQFVLTSSRAYNKYDVSWWGVVGGVTLWNTTLGRATHILINRDVQKDYDIATQFHNHFKYKYNYWSILAHEMAHIRIKNHDIDQFIPEVMRTRCFLNHQMKYFV